ncbi:MAG: site-specific integrase [Deltaproteobacteria bacterium]|nr:site-specific integrase [Deltaproteobacteria bacterium]MBT6022555.1 site-specific integrase [Candidatus Thioglobus sp.]MBT7483577.1 site-specific integrase [Candidatus Peregrinibacteria bacterium]MBT4091580.1 site-specific integrase [Deltaproteobacteria bacterium]MBT4264795.1 site-specific integrase [Deltaproteobacteria bacterium]
MEEIIRENVNYLTMSSVGKLKDWYLDLHEVKGLSSVQTIKARLKNILRILGADTTVNQLNKKLITQYRNTRKAEPSTRRKDQLVAVATVNKEITALKVMLNKALEDELIESNPIAKSKMEKEDNVRERVLTDEEFERLLNTSPEHLKPVFITAFFQPMRRREITGLTWDEVDLKSRPGFIRLANKRTKGGKSGRAIALHPRVRETLSRLPSRFKDGCVFLYEYMPGKHRPFDDFKHAFDTAKTKAKIEDFVFHDFRHCAITNLRKAGNDYSTIMKASGHKTMSMFFRYNMVDEEDIAGMKWKGEVEKSSEEIIEKLIAAGLDPEEVKKAFNQEKEKEEVNAVNLER